MRLQEEAKTRAEEADKQVQRQHVYREAQKREASRVNSILSKQQAKQAALDQLSQQRSHEADLKSLQHQLQLETKRGKVRLPLPGGGGKRL